MLHRVFGRDELRFVTRLELAVEGTICMNIDLTHSTQHSNLRQNRPTVQHLFTLQGVSYFNSIINNGIQF